MKILHIEDQKQISDVFSKILEKKGNQYESISDGKKGLELLLENDYDLIILDLAMPKFSGFAVLEELKQKRPDILKNIVVLTALRLSPDIELELLATGINSIEEKPISIERLLKRIKSSILIQN